MALKKRGELVRDARAVMSQVRGCQTILSENIQDVQKGLGNLDKRLEKIWEVLERINKYSDDMREQYEKVNNR